MTSANLISVEDLVRHYPSPRGVVRAVDGVSLHIRRGETLGLVGESGCGKTTTGRIVVNLDRASAGRVIFDGTDITSLPPEAQRQMRRRLQIIFQNPLSALDPRYTIGQQIREPLDIFGIGTPGARAETVARMFEAVALPADLAGRYPHQISGGQAQRAVIARALTLEPDLIVCDEPVSALDVSVQAKVVDLMAGLQRRLGVAYLFISHDLRVVKRLCHRVAVMYLGQIVEEAPTDPLYARPRHPYTQALLSAIPDMGHRGGRMLLSGDPPSPLDPPPGCRFHTRCPFARPRCAAEVPQLRSLAPGHRVRCHFAEHLEATP